MQANQTDCRFLTIWEVRIHDFVKRKWNEQYPGSKNFDDQSPIPGNWRFGALAVGAIALGAIAIGAIAGVVWQSVAPESAN